MSRSRWVFAGILWLGIVSGLSAIVIGCVTTAETNRRQLNFISDAQMNGMGVQAYQEMQKKEKISTDSRLKDVVVRVGKAIATASAKDYEWEFTLFDEPKTVNAFCLPGGKVGVYTGILPVAENEAGLAAIMGHEVAHAVLRHGAERVSQTMVVQMGVSLASLTFGDAKYRDLIAGALGVGLQFGVMLPFSRQHETEADKVGLKYMAMAGYDPQQAVSLWERMAKVGGKTPEIVSTHPDPARRARDLQSEIEKIKSIYDRSEKHPSAKI